MTGVAKLTLFSPFLDFYSNCYPSLKGNLVGTKKPSHQKRGEKGDHSKEAETQQRNGHQKSVWRTSLVVQWLGIRLPMQGTQIRSLVREDPTCRGATKPVRHNYWACALEPASHNYWAHVPQLLKPVHLEPVLHKRSHRATARNGPHSTQLEKTPRSNEDPTQPKSKINKQKSVWRRIYMNHFGPKLSFLIKL